MKWQCALLKRWLPEYPDGDLPAFWRGRLQGHLEHCAACRRELSELRATVAALEAAPVADPGPEFWGEFSRELHLKLARAAYADDPAPQLPTGRKFRMPYLLGGSALAILLLLVAVQYSGPVIPVPDQTRVKPQAAEKMAVAPRKARQAPAVAVTAPVARIEEVVPVALQGAGAMPPEEADLSEWDLDMELAGMTDQEKEIFLKRLHQRKKDGSWIEGFSLCSLG